MSRPSLRIVVIFVAALAGLKVWAQDRYQRGIFHETLIAAYGDQARARCQKEVSKAHALRLAASAEAMEITIGSPHTSVAVWDFDNPLWEVRYRHPHILLSPDKGEGPRCAYDVVAGLASLSGVRNSVEERN